MDRIETPTVGRTVHYVAYGTPGGEFPAGVCRAAIVTEVNRDEHGGSPVSLAVLNPTGLFFAQGCYHGTEPGRWHWPERA